MEHKLKILMTEFVTHNVKKFILEKPKNYKFIPGQATKISINKPGWKDKKRFFTYISSNEDLVLEFIIKNYVEHNGVTKKLHSLKSGDELLVEEPWGVMKYHGPGTFIAGGAGIAPFIAIFRQLKQEKKLKENKMIFSVRTSKDVILHDELKNMLGDNMKIVLTQEGNERICENLLQKNVKDFSQNFYICGPPAMVKDMSDALKKLGAKDKNIFYENKGKI